MPGARKNFIGLEGFIWWIGVVEDRQDPEKLGRVRVRCFGWHTDDKNKIPTESLPWAHPVTPINNPAAYTPKEGDMVFGFFVDGENGQNPAIVGVLPGVPEKKPDYSKGFSDPRKGFGSAPKKPDDSGEAYPKSKYLKEPTTSRLARGVPEGTVIATRKKNLKKGINSAKGISWDEPNPAYAAKYPYNYAHETESGHAFELDDTPGAERVHLAHRNGSSIEIDKNGNRVDKVTKDSYSVIMGDGFIYIKGKAAITVDGDFNLKTSAINIEASEINLAASGEVKIKGSAVKIESDSGMDLKAGGAGKFTSGGKMSIKGSTTTVEGAKVDVAGAQVNLQSGSADSASGTGLSSSGGAGGLTGAVAGGAVAGGAGGLAGAVSGAAGGGIGGALSSVAGGVAGGIAGAVNAVSGSALGKTLSGITSTVSGIVGQITNGADGILQGVASNSPLGELTNKIGDFENLVGEFKGPILGLEGAIKDTVLTKINEVAVAAIDKNIQFNVDGRIQNAIDNLTGNAVSETVTKLGKHVYPKTEVVTANTSGG